MEILGRTPAILAGAVLIATPAAALPAGARSFGHAGRTVSNATLALQAVIPLKSTPSGCPAGTPPEADECFARSGSALVHGLGSVSESYTFSLEQTAPGCSDGDLLLAANGRLAVAGKGTIEVTLAPGQDCFRPPTAVLTATRPVTILGGSGVYTGASGSGTIQHDVHAGPTGGTGTDTWAVNLTVPGKDFDLTPPTLRGARGITVRARHGMKRARVVYEVTARDDIDGIVPVTCRPRPESLFRIGRTRVSCSATDTSGNRATATFSITVLAPP